jgi:O-antigen/teichoic acid export membrane protein
VLSAVPTTTRARTALSTREIGLWAWSTVLATPLITLTAQLHHVAFPSLARLNEHHLDRYDEVVRTVARLQFLFASVAVGVLGGLALPMVRLVFDPRWLEATGAARAALLGVLPLALATLLAAALEARGRPYQRLRSMIMSSAGGLVAALFLAHAFGVTGAAVGVFIVVPLLDVLFLLRAAPVDLRRAIVDGVVLTSVTLGVASLAASRVDSLTDLFAAGSAIGLLGLGLIAVVDPKPVRRAWSLLRRR